MKKGHLIKSVDPGSIAEEMELEPGGVLLTIDGDEIEDIFDYEYKINSEEITLLVRKKNGEEWELDIVNEYQDLGITFENGLMSDYRSCRNKCIFCFIDQMPPGMRETLYFKDDDSRLSFLQGNYITLTRNAAFLAFTTGRAPRTWPLPPILPCMRCSTAGRRAAALRSTMTVSSRATATSAW